MKYQKNIHLLYIDISSIIVIVIISCNHGRKKIQTNAVFSVITIFGEKAIDLQVDFAIPRNNMENDRISQVGLWVTFLVIKCNVLKKTRVKKFEKHKWPCKRVQFTSKCDASLYTILADCSMYA